MHTTAYRTQSRIHRERAAHRAAQERRDTRTGLILMTAAFALIWGMTALTVISAGG